MPARQPGSMTETTRGTFPILSRSRSGGGSDQLVPMRPARCGSAAPGPACVARPPTRRNKGETNLRAMTVAAVIDGSARLDEVPEPALSDGTVLVQTMAVGICG